MFAWSRTFELRQFFFFTYVWTILPCHSTNEQPQATSTCRTVPPPSQYLPGHLNISQWPPRRVKDHKEGPNSGIYRRLGTRYIFFSLMSLFSISFQFFFTIDTMLLPTTVIWRQQWPATCMATEKQRCMPTPTRHNRHIDEATSVTTELLNVKCRARMSNRNAGGLKTSRKRVARA